MLKYDVEERVGPSELALAVFMQASEEKMEKENVGGNGP